VVGVVGVVGGRRRASAGVGKVDARTMALLRAAFEAGVEASAVRPKTDR